jgi:uncharacterized membrane protein YhhN
MKSKVITYSYIGFCIVYLLLIFLGREEAIAWYMKPFLIPFLFLLVYTSDNFSTKKILISALTLSWIGDIILMFVSKGKIYFIIGLTTFVISHILYITLFNKQLKTKNFKPRFVFLTGIGVILIYLLVLLSLLLPHLDDLKIPVILYAIVISTMLLFAFKGSLHWRNPANLYILFGAFIFVCSDSILAINKFYVVLPQASFLIMLTYLIAQFFIVTGILCLNKKNSIP